MIRSVSSIAIVALVGVIGVSRAAAESRTQHRGVLRGELPGLLSGPRQAGAAGSRLRLLIRLAVPRPDFERLRAARGMLVFGEEDRQLRQDELFHSQEELQAEIDRLHTPIRQAIEGLGGRVDRSFWVASVLVADLPVERIADLAADPRVLSIELDRRVGPTRQTCGSPPSSWSRNYTWQRTNIPGGNVPNGTVFRSGAEGPIKQEEAFAAGYRGQASLSSGVFRVPVTVADSGFDLETDQWRDSNCWCPPTTYDVPGGCPTPTLGVHGEFTSRVGGWLCRTVSRVNTSYTYDVYDDVYPGWDGFDTPRAVIWERGTNIGAYIHGTCTASLVAGNRYMDLYGDLSGGGGGCIQWCVSDLVGPGLCGVNGMYGAAPEAELHLLKIGEDQPGGFTTSSVEIQAVQDAVANGAWVFSMSYAGDPDPLSATSVAFDQAAHDFDLVIAVSAGNRGDSGSPAQVTHGLFNGLIVGSTGMRSIYTDAVSPGSSHGPLAWPLINPTSFSLRDGVNICAPGGYWTSDDVDALVLPIPDESFTQRVSYGQTNGLWVGAGLYGTSFACPLVAGAATLLLAERAEAADSSAQPLTSREVRAILLGQADETVASVPLNITNGESPYGYGQGRVDLLASASFFDQGGHLKKGWVRPSKPTKDYLYAFTQGQRVEVTLTWDRVVFPVDDPNCSNLQLEVHEGIISSPGGSSAGSLIASSTHPENNYERVVFNAPSTGDYTIRVTVPQGGFVLDGNPDRPVPFAFAVY